MTKYILSIVTLVSLASPVLAADIPMQDPTLATVNQRVAEMQSAITSATPRWQVYTSEQRDAERIADVAKMNGISIAEATKRARFAWFSQNAFLGRSPVWPHGSLVRDAATLSWHSAGGMSHYLGYDPVLGRHMQGIVNRNTVREDNMWYCETGKTYTYGATVSECK